MLQTSSLLADSLADRLVTTFVRSYGRTVSHRPNSWAKRRGW